MIWRVRARRRTDGLLCGLRPSCGFIRPPLATVAPSDCARSYMSAINDWLVVPEMDRRRMMLMTGIAAAAAAMPLPEARAFPFGQDAPPADRVPLLTAPPHGASAVSYVFQDEFD